MRIFHLCTAAEWAQARSDGQYVGSTRGASLAEVGFIHASRGDQWQRIRDALYSDVDEPLVLLVIDPERLTAPVIDEIGDPTTGETFPHIYGAVNVDAVVQVIDLGSAPAADSADAPAEPAAPLGVTAPVPSSEQPSKSFMQLFLEEIIFRIALGFGVITVAGAVGIAAQTTLGPHAGFWSAIAVLVVGTLIATRLVRARERSIERPRPCPGSSQQ
ncbi:DUF952 domain-containing protein [Nocardioides limicola]|uniref:DUF952 domain-containing protein n=1 Tax=Nocardioides limicola TaxID=2803368 RepID=UPI00193B1FC5|nr:DUF952 domain-containing protein [Nocardioides sp. DJM-14]